MADKVPVSDGGFDVNEYLERGLLRNQRNERNSADHTFTIDYKQQMINVLKVELDRAHEREQALLRVMEMLGRGASAPPFPERPAKRRYDREDEACHEREG